jgi:hypothetical protein
MRLLLLATTMLLLPGPAAGLVSARWDFPIDAQQVRNGPDPDGSTGSPGTGFGHFAFDADTATLHYTISWHDLEADLTKLHVHGPATPDQSNPNHLFEIFNTVQDVLDAEVDPRSDSFTGSIVLDDTATECAGLDSGTQLVAASDTLPCLLEARAYVNVHTEAFPVGEIRGNVVTGPALLVWSFPISEDQVRNGSEPDGSTDSLASGEGVFRYDVASGLLFYRIGWDGLEGDLTKLHVHGPAGPEQSNPNHLIEIFNSVQDVIDAGVDPRTGFVEGQIALDVLGTECTNEAATPTLASRGALACFLEDRAYVNVHTTIDPTGEIRGNLRLVPHPYTWIFPISEDQVKNGNEPDGSTDSPATGEGVLRYDTATGELAYEISWRGLEGGLTKLHVHGPADPQASNPNHLFEIFNTLQEIEDAGVDRFADTVFGSIQLERGAAACTDEPGMATEAAPGALPCFLEERAYVNVHTEVDPTGEIRGNLLLVPEPRGWLSGLSALLAVAYGRRRRARSATAASAAHASVPLDGWGTRWNV